MTSNAKHFRNIFIWLLILSCFMAGWVFSAWLKDKRENYQGLWKKVGEHEQRLRRMEAQ